MKQYTVQIYGNTDTCRKLQTWYPNITTYHGDYVTLLLVRNSILGILHAHYQNGGWSSIIINSVLDEHDDVQLQNKLDEWQIHYSITSNILTILSPNI